MARAHRHFISGQIYHITHRCHKREFLLKYAKDRHRWLQWLFEAKKRYGLIILNYAATSNHIHLLAYDSSDQDAIPRSMQLVAGRTGQEYNIRKRRKGAFWEDRYHATIIYISGSISHDICTAILHMLTFAIHSLNTSFSYVFQVANSGRYGGIQFFTINLSA